MFGKGSESFNVSGEYIQKQEIDLKPNNLIAVLPSLGSEFKITMDLQLTLINHFKPSDWYNILLFTVDKGLPGKHFSFIKQNTRLIGLV